MTRTTFRGSGTIQPSLNYPKRIRLNHATYADPAAVFHVVFRAAVGEEPFRSPVTAAAIWQLLLNEHDRASIHLFAACLMPDHLHLLLGPGDRDVIKWTSGFKSYSTRIAQDSRPQRILWQPGFFDRRVRDQAEFDRVLEYIIRNPIGAGLSTAPGQWQWAGVWLNHGD